jgi:NADPH-dependent curcumin reductase CurA
MGERFVNIINRQFRLAARPVGMPRRSDWSLTDLPVKQPGPGEFLVKVMLISLDPAMRGWMNEGRSYVRPVELGEVMRALALGQVIASQHPGFAAGEYVYGALGVQEYAIATGEGATKVDPRLAPLPVYLSVLGMPGLTAYFGMLDVGRPKPGETVVVSAASGAVGGVAGQIARITGCRTVGIAGGPDKCRYIVQELGYDAAIDYKARDVLEALGEHCPAGVDVYFDNVGGDILDAVLLRINRGARIPICGAISQYNNTAPIEGPSHYLSLLVNRARMEGFIVTDYASRYSEGIREMAGWMAAGKLKSKEDIVEGLESFPEALVKLYTGENFGKLILKIADE